MVDEWVFKRFWGMIKNRISKGRVRKGLVNTVRASALAAFLAGCGGGGGGASSPAPTPTPDPDPDPTPVNKAPTTLLTSTPGEKVAYGDRVSFEVEGTDDKVVNEVYGVFDGKATPSVILSPGMSVSVDFNYDNVDLGDHTFAAYAVDDEGEQGPISDVWNFTIFQPVSEREARDMIEDVLEEYANSKEIEGFKRDATFTLKDATTGLEEEVKADFLVIGNDGRYSVVEYVSATDNMVKENHEENLLRGFGGIPFIYVKKADSEGLEDDVRGFLGN